MQSEKNLKMTEELKRDVEKKVEGSKVQDFSWKNNKIALDWPQKSK